MSSNGPPRPGVRSPSFVPRGPALTDARILHYIKLGFYGEERRQRALAAAAASKPKRKPKTPSIASVVALLTNA